MATKEYQQELGAAAACVLRGVMATRDSNFRFKYNEMGKLFLGDRWLGFLKFVGNVALAGHHACMRTKTTYSRSPKKFIDETMKDFPSGT